MARLSRPTEIVNVVATLPGTQAESKDHVKETGERYVPGFKVAVVNRRDRYLLGGDHFPFLERGFPALRFTGNAEDFSHQHQDLRTEGGKKYGDLIEYMDFGYAAKIARVNAASLASLALAPAAPREVKVIPRNLTNKTELAWAPNGEPGLAGYRVVWRETTAAGWQGAKFVGNVTAFTSDLSKGNVFFGYSRSTGTVTSVRRRIRCRRADQPVGRQEEACLRGAAGFRIAPAPLPLAATKTVRLYGKAPQRSYGGFVRRTKRQARGRSEMTTTRLHFRPDRRTPGLQCAFGTHLSFHQEPHAGKPRPIVQASCQRRHSRHVAHPAVRHRKRLVRPRACDRGHVRGLPRALGTWMGGGKRGRDPRFLLCGQDRRIDLGPVRRAGTGRTGARHGPAAAGRGLAVRTGT
jgi:hypothetical protein